MISLSHFCIILVYWELISLIILLIREKVCRLIIIIHSSYRWIWIFYFNLRWKCILNRNIMISLLICLSWIILININFSNNSTNMITTNNFITILTFSTIFAILWSFITYFRISISKFINMLMIIVI